MFVLVESKVVVVLSGFTKCSIFFLNEVEGVVERGVVARAVVR